MDNVSETYASYVLQCSPQDLGNVREKWNLTHQYCDYVQDTTNRVLGYVFSGTTIESYSVYLGTQILSQILTPGKKNGLLADATPNDSILNHVYCDVQLPTLFFNALMLLKFMQFGDDQFNNFDAIRRVTSNTNGPVVGMKMLTFNSEAVSIETSLKGVKILCAIAALKPELYKAVQAAYADINKETLKNTLVYTSELFTLEVESGKAAIPLPRLVNSAQQFRAILDNLAAFARVIATLANKILDACGGSLEDFLNALFALDLDNITTYKEENTMLVVTEILKNLVNKGVLISRDGRLLSISIAEGDTVTVTPFKNDDSERPTIANLVLDNHGNREAIITLDDTRLRNIVTHAQNILDGPVMTVNGVTVRRGPVPSSQPTASQPEAPEMRRNADGSISVRRVINGVHMWAPASPQEAARFQHQDTETEAVQQVQSEETRFSPIDEENEHDESPDDVVMVSVMEENGVHVRRMTREEAEDRGLAILRVVEWSD